MCLNPHPLKEIASINLKTQAISRRCHPQTLTNAEQRPSSDPTKSKNDRLKSAIVFFITLSLRLLRIMNSVLPMIVRNGKTIDLNLRLFFFITLSLRLLRIMNSVLQVIVPNRKTIDLNLRLFFFITLSLRLLRIMNSVLQVIVPNRKTIDLNLRLFFL